MNASIEASFQALIFNKRQCQAFVPRLVTFLARKNQERRFTPETQAKALAWLAKTQAQLARADRELEALQQVSRRWNARRWGHMDELWGD